MSELIAAVEQDFEYDLEAGRNASWLSFPFREFIIANDKFKRVLFEQFKELTPSPKYHWFSESRLSEGYLTEDEKFRWDNKHGTGILYSDVGSN